MITFSSTKNTAAQVTSADASFLLFPATPVKGQWNLLSHPEEDLKEKVISWPGEYDFAGLTIHAIGQQEGGQVSYSCHIDGVRVAFIASPVLDWTDSEIESLGEIDILMIAADNPKKVSALAETTDPRILILFPAEKGDMAAVAKACGKDTVDSVSEFKVKPGSLPTDTRQVVILQ